ncbi:hypothetical protein G7Z17_g389 [Cylindrodendrum hubeiense]|uniref:Uncharacterized protein n=1 Tax=Cylindrodendrum hubeiense TaxID=595255 RepID=A0A9P5HLK0_9HYPO|nr:hypothetical protein G7Z17_g389 [Cylindrodendrum hubeiense]
MIQNLKGAVPRRFYSVIWFVGLVVVAFFFLSGKDHDWSSISSTESWNVPFMADDGLLGSVMGYFGEHPDEGEPTRIAVVNSIGVHDEVLAALVHAFGGHPNAKMNVYLHSQRYKMNDIISNFTLAANTTMKNIKAFRPAMFRNPHPHVVVSTTCEFDLGITKGALQNLLDNGNTHLFCVVHHADQWASGKHVDFARQWVNKGKLDFVGLSQHTADFLMNTTVPKWGTKQNITARVFPPVFPVERPEVDTDGDISLAMQGDYSSSRRDYKHIFTELAGVVDKVKNTPGPQENETVALHVIGHGKTPEVPDITKDHVIFDKSLSYPDFYAVLSRAFAVIPGFASDEYLDRKASSTVPAALIAGAPLLASEEILKAYSYLPREAAWVSIPGEEDMDAIKRVISNRDEYLKKRELTRLAADNIMEQNRLNVQGWIREVRQKMDAERAARQQKKIEEGKTNEESAPEETIPEQSVPEESIPEQSAAEENVSKA